LMQPPKESEEGILKHPVWEGGDVLMQPPKESKEGNPFGRAVEF